MSMLKNLFLAVMTLMVLPQAGQAATWNTCNGQSKQWTASPALTDIYYSSPATMPLYSERYNSVTTAVSYFNRNPSTRSFAGVTLRFGSSPSLGNGKNDFYFSDDPNVVDQLGAVTWTRHNTSTCAIQEADMIIGMSPNWQYYNNQLAANAIGYGGLLRNMPATVVHELGHFFGAAHESRYYNIMGDDFTHVNRKGSGASYSEGYVGEDLSQGMVGVYLLTTDTAKQDLGVSHWQRTSSSGGYSTHTRIPLMNSSSVALPCTPQFGTTCAGNPTEGDQYYHVSRGQSVRLRYNFENNGRDSRTVTVKYYLSTDRAITSSDSLLSTGTYTLTRGLPDLLTVALTIPSNLTVGTNYYLGVMVDTASAVAELDEGNNTSFTGIRVTN